MVMMMILVCDRDQLSTGGREKGPWTADDLKGIDLGKLMTVKDEDGSTHVLHKGLTAETVTF
jgi:hypothetical protein